MGVYHKMKCYYYKILLSQMPENGDHWMKNIMARRFSDHASFFNEKPFPLLAGETNETETIYSVNMNMLTNPSAGYASVSNERTVK